MKPEEIKNAVDLLVESPIAARLKADPGWRIVLMHLVKERDDGLAEYRIEVSPMKHWALDAPTLIPQKANSLLAMKIDSLFGQFLPQPRLQLWPIDPVSGKRFGNEIHRLVPPCAETDAELIKAAQLWCAETVEKNKKPTP